MREVTTYLCPGCTIKDNEEFSIVSCMRCPRQNNKTIITKIIKDQRSLYNTNESNKV